VLGAFDEQELDGDEGAFFDVEFDGKGLEQVAGVVEASGVDSFS